jgi:hypothetical protein
MTAVVDDTSDLSIAIRTALGKQTHAPFEIAPAPTEARQVTVEDFYAYMPMHQYIFVPDGQLWPASSVNGRVPPVAMGGNKTMKASDWLDQHRAVEQMTWMPGMPKVISDHLIADGGLIQRAGVASFNLYRAPRHAGGDPAQAGPWLTHVRKVFPAEAEHIISWCAHRVQWPGEKINHALVLGGAPGIGKDTLLEPVKYAVGGWNFAEVSPAQMLARFNGFAKSVILRISEARDLGDVDRYAFYEHMKIYMAAPPDVLRCDEKHVREYNVMNVTGVIITTNYRTNGIYLPADDRRHYVAWSEVTKEEFGADYWRELYSWFAASGREHVAAYLKGRDISTFDAKAPPPKTPAFWAIVDANRATEDFEFADVLEAWKYPDAVTIAMLIDAAKAQKRVIFAEWLADVRNRRAIPYRMEQAGYVAVRNDSVKDGLWKLGDRRQVIYTRKDMDPKEQIAAARALATSGRW